MFIRLLWAGAGIAAGLLIAGVVFSWMFPPQAPAPKVVVARVSPDYDDA